MLAALSAVALVAQAFAQEPPALRVAATTSLSQAIAKSFKGSTDKPWAKPGSPPNKDWQGSARTKYETCELAAIGYLTLNDLDKRFRDVAIAISMDWELMAAETYPLLQAAYEDVHPYRTGRIVRTNWTEAEGNRFAAITSSVGDVLLAEFTKKAELIGGAWPDFDHGLWFGQFSEKAAEQSLTQADWQLYQCDVLRNPILFKDNSSAAAIHFVPQLIWVTLSLDLSTFIGDVLIGNSKAKWIEYAERGAALWQEYIKVHSPVVKEVLQKLPIIEAETAPPAPAPAPAPSADDIITAARMLSDIAIAEYNATGGHVSSSTYARVREVILSVGVASNNTSPPSPTCAYKGNSQDASAFLAALV